MQKTQKYSYATVTNVTSISYKVCKWYPTKQQYIHGLQNDITIALCSLVPTILHEFHDPKGHQGTTHALKL